MTEILVSDFITVFLIFIRVTALLFTAPVFSNSVFPTTAKLFFGLIIAYVTFFTIPPYQFNYDQGILLLAFLGFKEAITGLIMGFALNFVFYGISYAGMQIGTDIGLNMASMMDPTIEMENNIIGQILNYAAILLFLTINGHHYIIRGLMISYKLIPLGHYSINQSVLELLVKYSAGIFIIAIKISAPIMVAFFLIHIASGIISRIIPQMQVFFVLQPVQIGVGLFLVVASIPLIVIVMRLLLQEYENTLMELIKVMGI